MGLFTVDLAKALTKDELDLFKRMLENFGTKAVGDEATDALGLLLRLSLNTEFRKSQLKEKMDMFLLAARFMNTTYDNYGNTVAALSEEEQQKLVDLLNKLRKIL